MTALEEKLISSETIFEGRVLRLQCDTVRLPNGSAATRETVIHPGAVAVIPVTDDGRIVLVRQYRHPVGQLLLEIPAGKLDKDEAPEVCAARELEEETGLKAEKMRKLSSVWTTPGFSNEIIHLYLAEGLVQVAQHLDEDEFLEVEYYTREQIRQMIAEGIICDAKSMLGLLLAGI